MNIWLIQANEPMPVVYPDQRLFRTGLVAEELFKLNHKITWFATTFDHFQKQQKFDCDTTVKVAENYDLNLIWAPSYKKNISVKRIINHKYMAIHFRKVVKSLEKPDLIFASFPTIEFAEEAIRYGKEHDVKVIIDIRDLWPDIFKQNVPKSVGWLITPYVVLMNKKTKRIMRDATAIVAMDENSLKWGLNKASRKKNDVDDYFYMGYKSRPLANIKKDNTALFRIGFFGTINNQFRFDIILKIAEKLKDENIIVYICGDGPVLPELREKSEHLSNIKFTGWLGQADLRNILSCLDVGLCPYKDTFDFAMGFPNKFAEYLSYSLPVIVTNHGDMEDLVIKEECGICSDNEIKIAEYIRMLSTTPEKYKKISQRAKATYQKYLNADIIYKDFALYLERMAKL